jgi:hypothetical protein
VGGVLVAGLSLLVGSETDAILLQLIEKDVCLHRAITLIVLLELLDDLLAHGVIEIQVFGRIPVEARGYLRCLHRRR